jgi:hypothetical protein
MVTPGLVVAGQLFWRPEAAEGHIHRRRRRPILHHNLRVSHRPISSFSVY